MYTLTDNRMINWKHMWHAIQPAELQNWMHNFKAPLHAFRPNHLLASCPLWHTMVKETCHPVWQCTMTYRTFKWRNFHATFMPSKAADIRMTKHFCLKVKYILCSDIQFSRLHFRMKIFLYKMEDGHRQWVNILRTDSAGQMAVKRGRI